jgi:A/G-specific adenine glycosylase
MSSPATRLLAWYELVRRDLPWRRSVDPWAIWVSEVMLQQTRVETARPYFERFMARFPTPLALAEADEAEVLALWSGLGYYRRARLLKAGAERVAAAGGELPRAAAALAELPGIGPYTAAAIASIAFGEPVPVLDGNVERVLARRLAWGDDPARASSRRVLLAAAAELVDPARPGESNQALMELGATLCSPRRPRCADCPLRPDCRAAAAGDAERYPRPRARREPERLRQTAALVTDGQGRLLLGRRGAGEQVLPGLWELPTVATRGPRRAAAALAACYGGEWRLAAPLGRLRHSVTYRVLDIELRVADWRPEAVAERGHLAWLARAERGALALTGATRKLLARFAAE